MKKLLIILLMALFIAGSAQATEEDRYIRKKTCIDKETGDFADFDKCDGSQDLRYKTIVTCHDKEKDFKEVDVDYCIKEM